MKSALALLLFVVFFGFTVAEDCGDGAIYANLSQTQYDSRFDGYSRIEGCPSFIGGDYKFFKLVCKNLKLSDEGKTQIFMLNYQFTITCDGKIQEVKQLGDSRADEWTNIVEIIKGTEGQWAPAKKGGTPVSCIYFRKLFIDGTKY